MRSLFARTLALAIIASSVALAQSYCTPSATGFSCVGGDESIGNVAFLSINNSSVCGTAPGYEDYTTTVAPASVVPGVTYPIAVTISQYWSTDHVYVMLDADGDFTFAASEILANLSSSTTGTGTASYVMTGSITIPATATPGITTRLRVRLTYGAAAVGSEACGTATFGNCEDYAVVIANSVVPEYQVNQPGSSFDINGVTGGAFVTAQTQVCVNQPFVVNLNSTYLGNPFDVAISPSAIVSRTQGALATGTGQLVNIDLANFSLVFGGFTLPIFPAALPASLPAPLFLSLQQVVLAPSAPDGLQFSQPVGLTVSAGATFPIAGPTGDDSVVTIANPCVTFFGAYQTSMWVTTNGRMGFGGTGSTAWAPSVAQAMTDSPWVGAWCDMNQGLGGSINITSPAAGVMRVDYAGVPYYATAIANTYYVEFDSSNGYVTIGNLAGIGVNTSTQMIGISAGNLGATDPGATTYAPGFNLGPAGLGMIYAIGTEGSLTPGLNSLVFTPNGNHYDWTGL